MRPKQDSANLDLLRATAVTIVLIFHLLLFHGKTTIAHISVRRLGLMGVLLFFVHTSLVLMFSLERQQSKFEGQKLYWSFMLRRCFRIYPLSVLVVAIIFFFRLPLGHLEPGHMFPASMSSFGFLSNLLLVQNLTETSSILGPLWSLPYEMQMYVFLPLLFLLAQRLRSSWVLMGMWVAAVGVALVHARVGHMPDLVKYVPCFLPGIIAYKLSSRTRSRWPFFGWPLVLAGLIVLSMVSYDFERGWLICLLTGLAVPQFAEMSNRWLKKISHVIAKYSYGIYLVHYACMWLAFVKLGYLPAVTQWIVFAVSLAVLPALLYHALEAPMIGVGGQVVDRLFLVRSAPARGQKATAPAKS